MSIKICDLMKQTNDPNVMKTWVSIIQKYAEKLSVENYIKFYDEIYNTINDGTLKKD